MADIEHKNITNTNLHEPLDVVTAVDNTTYVADGAGSGTWKEPEPKGFGTAVDDTIYVADGADSGTFKSVGQVYHGGWWDYNDAATASSPIALTTGSDIYLTNDGAGAFTRKAYKPSDLTEIWIAVDGEFDFTELALGDMVDIRCDVAVTTTAANTVIETAMDLGIGALPYNLAFDTRYFKSAGTYHVMTNMLLYMGDANTLDHPAKIAMKSDAGSATAVVNGWYVRVLRQGL